MKNASAHDPHGSEDPADAAALERVVPVVYDELRRLAHRQLRREPAGLTLRTTDLVHEAYLRLAGQASAPWKSRAHFMALASMAMRGILIDHARAHRSVKRGGGVPRVSLDDVEVPAEDRAEFLLALDEALDRLQGLDARQARVVSYRFFGEAEPMLHEAVTLLGQAYPDGHPEAALALREWAFLVSAPWPPRRVGGASA